MDAVNQAQSKLRILLVDDDENDYAWTRRVLASAGMVQVDWAPSYEHGCAAIRAGTHDVILVDYRLQHADGRDGLDIVRHAREHTGVPCILFTAAPRVGLELASLSAGAVGYLAKSEISPSRLVYAILQALERGKTESELFQKNRALALILRASEAANEALSERRAFEACLRDVCVELGWEASDAVLFSERGEPSLLTLHARDARQKDQLAELRARQLPSTTSGPFAQVLRTQKWVYCSELPLSDSDGYRDLYYASIRSALLLPVLTRGEVVAVLELYSASCQPPEAWVTETLTAVAAQLAQTVVRARAEADRKRAESELRRSQRLDALGRLAGGLAHDFNNLLTVITASAEMLLTQPPEQRTDGPIEAVRDAAERGARLTRQLLALGRKSAVSPRTLDLNELIRNNEALLRRTLPERIELRFELASDVGPIKVDPNDFSQLLLNLVLNARDAIEDGGVVTVATDTCMPQARSRIAAGQRCARVSVRDTGVGMSAETLERIFDPFFTTKAPDKGTGLGLSCAYSIVRQAGGDIDLESEPGAGTLLRLYFPSRADAAPDQRSSDVNAIAPGGTETILLVEDDRAVRSSASLVLESFGYQVLCAARAEEALTMARRVSKIDLVLSDVVMPEMSGVELAGQLARLHPGLPVLFMSGYAQAAVEQEGLVDVARRLVPKPFTARELALHVRTTLDDAVRMAKPAGKLGPH